MRRSLLIASGQGFVDRHGALNAASQVSFPMAHTGLLSAREAIAKLGGAASVARELHVRDGTVRMWAHTNRIPATLSCAFLQLCVERELLWRPPGWNLRVQLRFHPYLTVGVVPREARAATG